MLPLNAEEERINLLLQRDGLEATRNWVARTLNIYREAVASPASHASQKNYKPLFEKSIKEFEEWLSLTQEPTPET
ncbi:hypothetical protein Nhal_2143 [Nitrosococcus halophilus Nc 4]|uniref:Uncharacterized protein n=1 Tax=Nitrosococcus halophilus (strain Nc4) TaxID=472759 RepID=D5C519_NITHN|nr:hypothetical protein [Nitrosococcus halophilus]ADE15242.1 hypothetical protein Nhal_2143 [Nitrosococcus halophilus Nc 4]